jgi:alkylglycerol monooxygenase
MDKLALLIPVFLLLAMGEWWLTRKSSPNAFTKENTVLNICVGAIDRILSLASFSLFIFALKLTYDHFRLWTPEITWYHWVLAYFAVDFISYWYHRLSHRIALLWCGHVTHHSSDHYNLTNGFRTSPFQGLYRIPFWIVLPVLGFSPEVLLVTFVVSGLYDFFLHTEHFPKLRWLEYFLITPSLHKVHHGKNDIYIDKNYGATFVIWDRMFGTFQDETVPVKYGILSEDYRDGDPVDAILHHYKYLWLLIKTTRSWTSRIKLLIMPPDWVPDDLSDPVGLPPATILPPDRPRLVYALAQLAFCSVGIITILVCEQQVPLAHFILFAGFFLTGMIGATRIYNGRAGIYSRRNELWRNLLFAASFGLFFFVSKDYPAYLLLGVALAILGIGWSFRLPAADKKAVLEEVPAVHDPVG